MLMIQRNENLIDSSRMEICVSVFYICAQIVSIQSNGVPFILNFFWLGFSLSIFLRNRVLIVAQQNNSVKY